MKIWEINIIAIYSPFLVSLVKGYNWIHFAYKDLSAMIIESFRVFSIVYAFSYYSVYEYLGKTGYSLLDAIIHYFGNLYIS
jgi:hypothetical protein